MRYIRLTEEEITELTKRSENSDNKVERKRSNCLLLSHRQYCINDITEILGISRRSMERLFNSWEVDKYDSLRIKSGRGAKFKLRNLEEVVHSQLQYHNRNLTNVLDYLKEHHKVIVSKDTLKRFLKR